MARLHRVDHGGAIGCNYRMRLTANTISVECIQLLPS
jgi:hypothetical protein